MKYDPHLDSPDDRHRRVVRPDLSLNGYTVVWICGCVAAVIFAYLEWVA